MMLKGGEMVEGTTVKLRDGEGHCKLRREWTRLSDHLKEIIREREGERRGEEEIESGGKKEESHTG